MKDFPGAFEKAVVTPFIKKDLLHGIELKNYRPVSDLCFVSSLVEQVIAKQLKSHINSNNLESPYQSAYKLGHSSETDLLSIKYEVHLFGMK